MSVRGRGSVKSDELPVVCGVVRMSYLVVLAVSLLLVQRATSQRLSSGPCLQLSPAPSFHLSHMEGQWYEVERSFYLVESALRCTRVNFTLSHAADKDKLHVRIIYKLPWKEELSSADYEADVTSQRGASGVLDLVMSESPPYIARLAPGSGTYTVIDLDPDDYAVIYSCTDFRFFHADFVWILGRSEDISAEMRLRAYAAMDRLSVPRERLLLTKQDC